VARRAIRVMGYLVNTEAEGAVVPATRIGEALDIAPGQLTKVLQRLVGVGQLISRRGRSGGFTAHGGSRRSTLLQIVEAVDGPLERFANVAGPLGELQRSVLSRVREYLGAVRLADLKPRRPSS
jgi:DNA-binding IscR family transcriptional regulator